MPDPNKMIFKCRLCGKEVFGGMFSDEFCSSYCQSHYKDAMTADKIIINSREGTSQGLKLDSNKQPYYAMPLVVLKPLADLYAAGEKKYSTFNNLKPFEDGDRRFWDAIMRHLEKCQMDSLAKDEETDCYHLAAVAFNALHRLHDALQKEKTCQKHS